MANDNLEKMAVEYDNLESKKNTNALGYFVGTIVLFLFTLAAVVFAETVAELVIGGAETRALAITKEQLEKVELRRRHDFNGIATMRDGETAVVAGDDGLVMISDGDRRSWVKAPSNTERSVYGVALSDDGETAVAIGDNGLVRISRNGGKTWANPGDLSGKDSSGVAMSDNGMIAVAVGDEGLVRISRDSGKTWANPGDLAREDIHGVALSQNGKVAIFVGDGGLIQVSSDGGATWNTGGRHARKTRRFQGRGSQRRW